jgi:hypothetical protein
MEFRSFEWITFFRKMVDVLIELSRVSQKHRN